jgi:hypothetical protein
MSGRAGRGRITASTSPGSRRLITLGQLSPVRLSARDLLPVDLGAPGRGQLGHLAG